MNSSTSQVIALVTPDTKHLCSYCEQPSLYKEISEPSADAYGSMRSHIDYACKPCANIFMDAAAIDEAERDAAMIAQFEAMDTTSGASDALDHAINCLIR